MSNSLLKMNGLPEFSAMKPAEVVPAVTAIIDENKKQIQQLLSALDGAQADQQSASWSNLIEPMAHLDTRLSEIWSPVGHLNAVMNNSELRDAYNTCLPLLAEYSTEMGQNEKLYKAVSDISQSDAYQGFDTAQKKVIDNQLRDFHLSGIDLPSEKKQRYGEIKKRLSELSSQFSENVLDATQAWSKLVTDKMELAGLPSSALISAQNAAKQKELEGYRFTLDFPSYFAVITYADSRELRKEIYQAFVTRASEVGPNKGQWDNGDIMQEILRLRDELAKLLNFSSYAEYSLATKMAESSDQVLEFLEDLADKSAIQAQKEYDELREYANNQTGKIASIADLQAWDISYYAEKLKQEKYAVSQEELRPYFPAPHVVSGMFEVVGRLYDIHFQENITANVWHEDAGYFELLDKNKNVIAGFYLDLYARENKRGGAWMDECKVRHLNKEGQLQIPVAYLTCNFTSPVGDDPALLTHNEVTTLFHEFGHGLHHMLTKIVYPSVSGINGVAWDAVELPSQFMENWCWQKEAIDLISCHYQTGESLPSALLDKMLAAKNYQSAMMMARQLEFSLFDMRLHIQAANVEVDQKIDIQGVLNTVREKVAVITPPEFNRFQNGFSHIFGGGYAAGYYSYKWAEVLSADAFSLFEETGIFDKTSGYAFKEKILEQGGAQEPVDLFKSFRGREPSIDALLRHSGIMVSV
ncbi:MAG: oligopeptidase A [Pseudomonadales bacterium]|nr:oligopeptidase A [Pseudomonadales bacterium]